MGGGRPVLWNLAFFSEEAGFTRFQGVTPRFSRVSLILAAGQRAARPPGF
jgi:hypothetical protein